MDVENSLSLLKESFDRPVGTDIANRISFTISQKGLERIEEIKTSFTEGYCPYCFRDIKVDYVAHIIEEINKSQNESIKKHIDDLKSSIVADVFVNLSDFQQLDNELCLEIERDVNLLNQSIKSLNDKIHEKINNPYESIEITAVFDEVTEKINHEIKSLESKRVAFNDDVKNKVKLKQEVQLLNYVRVAHALDAIIAGYKKQTKEQKTQNEAKAKLEEDIDGKTREIARLNAESKNIGIALNEINNFLGLIFLSKDRISIEESDGKYLIKVRKKPIPLKKLSNGERNAIALCYFFVAMNENCSEEDVFKVASLVILDDPLSSFDYNNKIGIYSFLRRMISSIAKNHLSKIMILTHQIETFFDMNKVFDDINGIKKKTAILRNKKLEDYSGKLNVYRILLKEIYNSAQTTDPLSDDDIENLGNKLRKVLEAFSTFSYGCSIEKLSTDPTILSIIKDDELRKYLEDSLYRISLNTSSHFEERTYSLVDRLNIVYFERDELLRSVKDSLLLLYSLNQNHIMKILELKDTGFFDDYAKFVKKSVSDKGNE